MKLTIADFDYTKDDGDTTHRRVLILSRPSESYFGVELETDADLDRYKDYLLEREELEEKLKKKHGINDQSVKFRRFKTKNIFALTEEKQEV